MKFPPKTRQELAEQFLIPKGTYDALVESAEEKVSKAGNDMIELTLRVYNGEQEVLIKDWILPETLKLFNFCESAGLMDTYNAGELTGRSCQQANVAVRVDIEDAKGDYPPKNKIAGYVKRQLASSAAPASNGGTIQGADRNQFARAQAAAPPGDDIPFMWIGLLLSLGSLWM